MHSKSPSTIANFKPFKLDEHDGRRSALLHQNNNNTQFHRPTKSQTP